MRKYQAIAILANISLSISLFAITASSLSAEDMTSHNTTSQRFQSIEQPMSLKIAIAVGGLSLMVAQLWWFLGSKSKSD